MPHEIHDITSLTGVTSDVGVPSTYLVSLPFAVSIELHSICCSLYTLSVQIGAFFYAVYVINRRGFVYTGISKMNIIWYNDQAQTDIRYQHIHIDNTDLDNIYNLL